MKKSTKTIVLIASCLAVIGALLIAAGVTTGASFKQIYQKGLWNNTYYEEGYDNTFRDDGTYEIEAESIEKISIDWASGNISIMPYSGNQIIIEETSQKKITDENFLRYRVEDGVLAIDCCTGKIGINFSSIGDEPVKSICIKVPENFATDLKSIDIDTVSSDISIKEFNLDSMNIDQTSGNIKLTGINARNFEMDTVSGNLEAYFVSCPEEFEFDSTSGDSVVYLPSDSSFKTCFDSTSGEFTSEFSYRIDSDDTYIIGNGKNSFEFDTVSGDFVLRINKNANI